jgi:hypothetical protein
LLISMTAPDHWSRVFVPEGIGPGVDHDVYLNFQFTDAYPSKRTSPE